MTQISGCFSTIDGHRLSQTKEQLLSQSLLHQSESQIQQQQTQKKRDKKYLAKQQQSLECEGDTFNPNNFPPVAAFLEGYNAQLHKQQKGKSTPIYNQRGLD